MSVNPSTFSSFGGLSEASLGFKRVQQRMNENARKIASGDISPSRMADLLVDKNAFMLNGAVVQTSDGMIGTLLNSKR